MRFAYARRGGPLLDWSGPTPPFQSRAGETRSLGDFYPTQRTSNALRRYGGRGAPKGAAVGYEHNRPLGYWGAQTAGHGGAGYRPPHMLPSNTLLGDLFLPRPGAPEVVEDYEPPAPGAAIVHLGGRMMSSYPWDEKYPGQTNLSGYMPEGAARNYGQTMLSADPPAPSPVNVGGLVRKAGILAAAYHGVKRNNGSILSGLLWAVAAWAVFPFYGTIVPAIAAAQGFAQPKARNNPARRRKAGGRTAWRRRLRAAKKRRSPSKRRTVRRRVAKATKRWGTRRGY